VAARLLQVVVFPYRGCSFTAVAMGRIAIGIAFLQLPKPLTWDLVKPRFARLKCNRARTAFQEEHKAKKTYRQFYRQSAFPAMTFSNLQRREAPLSTCNHC
jgi:hypothetical protein